MLKNLKTPEIAVAIPTMGTSGAVLAMKEEVKAWLQPWKYFKVGLQDVGDCL